MNEDPYVYPGTNVLKNLADIQDFKELETFEASVTYARLRELHEHPLSGFFDTSHLQRIHRYIFQDVYAWAGELRSVDLSKPGEVWFARPEYIKPTLDQLGKKLAEENHLRGLEKDSFVTRGAYYWGEVNAIHPFREGNGRTQREFVRELGLQAGYAIEWSRITPEEIRNASVQSFGKGDNSGFEQVLRKASTRCR